MKRIPFSPICYLGCGWDKAWVVMVDSAVDEVEGSTLFSMTIEQRLDPPRLSIDFMYSDALFSMMRASSNSRTMSTMFGLYAEKGSRHCRATSTTLHIASAWYPPLMPGSTISSIFDARTYGLACNASKVNSQ